MKQRKKKYTNGSGWVEVKPDTRDYRGYLLHWAGMRLVPPISCQKCKKIMKPNHVAGGYHYDCECGERVIYTKCSIT